jgi:hypothetical protein
MPRSVILVLLCFICLSEETAVKTNGDSKSAYCIVFVKLKWMWQTISGHIQSLRLLVQAANPDLSLSLRTQENPEGRGNPLTSTS